MKLNVSFPHQVIGNIEQLLAITGQAAAVHLGACEGKARLCIDYGVGTPGRAEETVVTLSYIVGTCSEGRSRMFLLAHPKQLTNWLKDNLLLDGRELSAEYDPQFGGFLMSRLEGAAEEPGVVVAAEPAPGYPVPASLPRRDTPGVVYDGRRYAGLELTSVPGSLLVVDLGSDPLDRARFAAAVEQVSGRKIEGPARFGSATEPAEDNSKPENKETEMTAPAAAIPELPEVPEIPDAADESILDAVSAPLPAAEPKASKSSRKSKAKGKDKAETPATEPVSEPLPAPDPSAAPVPGTPYPEPVAAPAPAPETPSPIPLTPPPADDNGDDDSGATSRRSRRSSADLDRDAEQRLAGRGFCVIAPAGGLFTEGGLEDVCSQYAALSERLAVYGNALRDRFIAAVAERSDAAQKIASIKQQMKDLLDKV